MKIVTLTAFILLISFNIFAQVVYKVQGKVIDSAANLKLENTSVSLLNKKDSTIVKFNWTDKNGNYTINNLTKGNFILLLSYPDYVDYVQQFELDSLKSVYDFGIINLTPKITLLNEVIIKGKVTSIKIKGDTTEFNAAAFVVQPNAKVEDLLKQLPGIQIDNNGKITAHGQTVKKILIDGEEFFGDDPTLISRNLLANMVDKIQLYDKKSDQAAFTGIDDGVKNKTINLMLKEDKKKGSFGKLDAGIGSSGFYQAQAMANLFREKQKMAVYANSSNTGRTGLSSSENNRYGTDGGTIEFLSGGISISGSNADEIESSSGRYNGQGIPLANTSGAHYDGKWNSDKESINTNFKIGSLRIDGERNTISQNDLPNGLVLTNQKQDFSNYNFRQRVDAAYQINFNNSSSLKIKVDAINKQSDAESNYVGGSKNDADRLLNQSVRKLTNEGDQQSFNFSALFSKKLKKTGRTFSWNLVQNISRDYSDGFLNTVNTFYNENGDLTNSQLVDQFKTTDKALNAFNNNITYSEPISKTFAMLINYRLGLINSKADRKSFNPTMDGDYTILDTEFSNNFILDQFSNQGGISFTYQKSKQRISFGSKLTNVDFKQTDLYNNLQYKRNFLNLNPQVTYQFRFTPQKTFQLGYYGNTIQPSIDQIQPVRMNTDPLNIIIGNTNLRPAFKHELNLSYNSYHPISGLSINLISSFDLTKNPIVSLINTDRFGSSIYQATNLSTKEVNGFLLRGGLGKQLKSIDAFIGLNFYFETRNNYGISNNEINKRYNDNLTTSISFSKNKAKKYDLDFGFGPRIFNGYSSFQRQLNNNGYGFDSYMNLNIYLPGKFEFRSSSSFTFQSKTKVFNNDFNSIIINSSISRRFLKEETLRLSISGNDILNQNTGFNRTTFGTLITQNNYTNIARYFMFSLTWDFSKFGKTATQ